MNWNSIDFLIIGILLLVALCLFFGITTWVKKQAHQRILFMVLALLILLVWIELGVGIFGTSLAGD